MRLTKKRNPEQPKEPAYPQTHSGPTGVYPPQPTRQRMPDGWKYAEPFDYLIVTESFYIGSRYFNKGDFVRRNDPLVNKLIYEAAEWIHVVDLNAKPKEA